MNFDVFTYVNRFGLSACPTVCCNMFCYMTNIYLSEAIAVELYPTGIALSAVRTTLPLVSDRRRSSSLTRTRTVLWIWYCVLGGRPWPETVKPSERCYWLGQLTRLRPSVTRTPNSEYSLNYSKLGPNDLQGFQII